MGRRKQGRINKIKQQPKEVMDFIKEKILEGNLTLEELRELINKHPLCKEEIKLGSMWSFAKEIEEEYKEIEELNKFFEVTKNKFSFDTEKSVHRYIVQVLSKTIVKQISGKGDIPVKEVFLIARALKDLMTSIKDREKTDIDIENRIKQEVSKSLDKAGKDQGLSENAINNIKKALNI